VSTSPSRPSRSPVAPGRTGGAGGLLSNASVLILIAVLLAFACGVAWFLFTFVLAGQTI
jgi:hypothetical protein